MRCQTVSDSNKFNFGRISKFKRDIIPTKRLNKKFLQNCPSTQYVLQNYKVSRNSVERFQRKGTVDWQTGQKQHILRNSLCGVVVVVVVFGVVYWTVQHPYKHSLLIYSSPTYICAVKLLKKLVYQVKNTYTYFLHPASMFARPQVLNPSHMLRFNTWSSERCPNHLQSKRRKKLIHTCNLISFYEKPGHKIEKMVRMLYITNFNFTARYA